MVEAAQGPRRGGGMADASVSKTDVRKDVRVRLPLSAPPNTDFFAQNPEVRAPNTHFFAQNLQFAGRNRAVFCQNLSAHRD